MPGAQFVREHIDEIIQRVTMVMPIADVLLSRGMISLEEYGLVRAARSHQDQMRVLLCSLLSRGEAFQSDFCKVLQEKEPFVMEHLGQALRLSTHGSEISQLRHTHSLTPRQPAHSHTTVWPDGDQRLTVNIGEAHSGLDTPS
ncbi:hypothetical protein ACEWY4_006363 [Coilia grayii]|uniref:CARD domain-containing protein n=1 Tax=Coilia grayii TaxID=363190 RepID=A0ABD1KDT6_9TELE